MKITYEFDEHDFLNFQSYFRGWEILAWFIIELIIIIIGLLVGAIVYWISDNLNGGILASLMILISCNLILFCFLWLLAVIKLRSARKSNMFGKIDFTFSEQGFHLFHHRLTEQDTDYHGHFQTWSVIKKVKETKDYFFLSLDWGKEFIIPKRAFPTLTEVVDFQENVNNWISTALKAGN